MDVNPLVTIINTIREEQLSLHYQAAFIELKELVKNEPLKTVFCVYSGCISTDVATEIAHRLSVDDYTATVCSSFLSSKVYLEVKMPLPENLIHKNLIETRIIENKEVDITTQSTADLTIV